MARSWYCWPQEEELRRRRLAGERLNRHCGRRGEGGAGLARASARDRECAVARTQKALLRPCHFM